MMMVRPSKKETSFASIYSVLRTYLTDHLLPALALNSSERPFPGMTAREEAQLVLRKDQVTSLWQERRHKAILCSVEDYMGVLEGELRGTL